MKDERTEMIQSQDAQRTYASPYAIAAVACVVTWLALTPVLAYLAWKEWHGLQVLADEAITQAPAGCIADRVRDEIQQGLQPLSYGTYATIEKNCDDGARAYRANALIHRDLMKQREALEARWGAR